MAETHVDQSNELGQRHGLTLHSACLSFEELQIDAEELAGLAWVAAGNGDFDEQTRGAFHAISALAGHLAKRAGSLSEEYIAAHRADRAANEPDLPGAAA